MSVRVFLIVLTSLIMTGCGGAADRYGGPGAGFAETPAAVLAKVDWSRARAVTVDLESFDFGPSVLTFRADQPYALTLVNKSSGSHTFTAPEFFRSIAVHSLSGQRDGGAVQELQSIGLKGGETRRLDFVSVQKGSYHLECSEPLHALFGMTGTIRVE